MDDLILSARVRYTLPDPLAGLKGHDYIAARRLTPRVGAKALRLVDECQCEPCVQQRLLPAVQAIVSNWPVHGVSHAAAR